jgi:putative addiction module killer protein
VVEILEYQDRTGRSPFAAWFDTLDARAAAKITASLIQLRGGNWSNVKSVGEGVHERKIDFGPGYRVYFGKDGEKAVILVGGGTKKSQVADIREAKARWDDYKRRKNTRR